MLGSRYRKQMLAVVLGLLAQLCDPQSHHLDTHIGQQPVSVDLR